MLIGTGRNVLPGDLGVSICDAAARFETAVAKPTRPTWINYSGGDTLLSLAITDKPVDTTHIAGELHARVAFRPVP